MFGVRRLATAALILLMAAGITAFATIGFGRQFNAQESSAGPATSGSAIGRLQSHLRAQPKDADGWSTLGLAYVDQARLTADPAYYPKAEGVLRRSLNVRPNDNEPALTGLGALAAARHDFGTALRYADQALALNSYSMKAHAVRVDALVELGRYDEAWDAVRQADSAKPGIPIFTRYAYVQELRGEPGKAREVLERAADVATEQADVAYVNAQLGDLAWSEGDLKTADRRYDAALRADPNHLAALDGKARVKAARGDLDGAIRDRTALAQRVPLPTYVVALGELYEARGMKDQAQRQYAVAGAWNTLARANGVSTDLEMALIAADHGDKAAALRSAQAEWGKRHSVHVADALAWTLHVNGRDEEALKYAKEASRTGYRNAMFLYHQGMIEKSLGRDADARRSLKAALKLNPHFSELQAATARTTLKAL